MTLLLRSALIALVAGGVAVAAMLVIRSDGDETVFTAEEFVARANETGAGIVLRDSLELFSEGSESHAISFVAAGGAGAAPAAAGEAGADHAHGAATLSVSEDSEGALETYRRCEGAVTLVCFRAANVALQVQSVTPDELARLEAAFVALGEPE